ncbi:MAG: hypothetical protein EOM03_13325 [Clostridia bacterium]|nr:hypothetical protein [Clostridia bacterium]
MNYGQVRDTALRLINSESIAGTTIPTSYNNQADYLAAIPQLVDDAQLYIATTVRRLHATVALASLPSAAFGAAYTAYTLPSDFWRLLEAGLFDASDATVSRFQQYKLIDDNKLLLPVGVSTENLFVEYFRFPRSVGAEPADATELDNALDTQMAVPYYVAAHLIMYDDAFRYSALYNEWETRLGRLGESVRMTPDAVVDVYTFDYDT